MKLRLKLTAFLFSIFFISITVTGQELQDELRLWFKQPASGWNEALPIGNGRLGAMVFGGVEQERLQLNEESVWTKGSTLEDKEDGYKAIPEIRELLFKGEYEKAEQMCKKELMSERLPSGTNTYQTLGNLNIQFEGVDNYSHYKRELQLDSALVKTTFNSNGTKHTRTVFSSAADEALVMLAKAGKPGQITCTLDLSRPGEGEKIKVTDGLITMKQHLSNGKGVKYETRLRVIPHGGKMEANGNSIQITEADKLELRLVAATDYRGENPSKKCTGYLETLQSKSYRQILNDHVGEYQQYFKRVS
ncbi:MAG: glycoside hydrolase family 95 protein, partial [Bacteroidales bacterium]|nr:glycoside hydrolase family 95 protein [Bacteroidales bacterium]